MSLEAKKVSPFLIHGTVIALVAFFAASVVKLISNRHAAPVLPSGRSSADPLTPDDRIQDVMILIGSSHCGYSTDPKLKGAYDRLVAANDKAHHFGPTLRIGVSMDEDARRGFEWLQSVGRFDEVDIGGNWLNDAVVNYIWSERAAPPSIPQILLVERHIHEAGLPSPRISVTKARIIRRAAGLDHITQWLDSVEAEVD
jgi:hypothetical protein